MVSPSTWNFDRGSFTGPRDLDDILQLQIKLVNCTSDEQASGIRAEIEMRNRSLLAAFRDGDIDEWEGYSHQQMITRMIERRWALVQAHGYTPKVKEYIDEAQHQDGIEYWMNFNTDEDVLYDYSLYEQALGE